jgi:(p)ppGpp synthase/HD superfamily hydrolase
MAIAAILHDVIEDTEENKAEVAIEIYKNFGEEVLKLCLQLTKYSKKPTYKDFEGYTDTPTYKFIDEN